MPNSNKYLVETYILTERQSQCDLDLDETVEFWKLPRSVQFVADLRRVTSLQVAPREEKTLPKLAVQEVTITVL
jgi:hypothetical protein